MRIGESLALESTLTDENMTYLKQLGVDDLMVAIAPPGADEPKEKSPLSGLRTGASFAYEDLVALKKWVESHGFRLYGLGLLMWPRWGKILLGKPGRDAEIEGWGKSLRNMGKAGIPLLQYNIMINEGAWIPLWRTSADYVGRGGTRIVRFNYDFARNAPLTSLGVISDGEMWDNLGYFLKTIVPVAEEAGVTLAMHPCDPQVPQLAGIARIIRSVESYDRLFQMLFVRANKMCFCLGCFAQLMEAAEVYETIRHFGVAGRIGNVHFRGVRGTPEKFDEVFADEGKLDMIQAIKALKESGFNGTIQIDHAPHPTSDTEYGHRSHAVQVGYLKGILQGAGALD
jgi:mannonate dehydratase